MALFKDVGCPQELKKPWLYWAVLKFVISGAVPYSARHAKQNVLVMKVYNLGVLGFEQNCSR